MRCINSGGGGGGIICRCKEKAADDGRYDGGGHSFGHYIDCTNLLDWIPEVYIVIYTSAIEYFLLSVIYIIMAVYIDMSGELECIDFVLFTDKTRSQTVLLSHNWQPAIRDVLVIRPTRKTICLIMLIVIIL